MAHTNSLSHKIGVIIGTLEDVQGHTYAKYYSDVFHSMLSRLTHGYISTFLWKNDHRISEAILYTVDLMELIRSEDIAMDIKNEYIQSLKDCLHYFECEQKIRKKNRK